MYNANGWSWTHLSAIDYFADDCQTARPVLPAFPVLPDVQSKMSEITHAYTYYKFSYLFSQLIYGWTFCENAWFGVASEAGPATAHQ